MQPTCRNCGAAANNQFIRADYVFGGSDEYKFWECKECKLVYLFPIPTQEEENRFYAEEFEKFMISRSGGDRDWSGPEAHVRTNQDHAVRRWKYIKPYAENASNVLEIGCSSGFMLDVFKESRLDAIGIEPSGGFGDYLTNKGHKHFNSVQDMLAVNPDIKFDLIVHFFVLEHIRDTSSFLSEQLSLLKKGGWIIAEVPCVNDPLTSLYDIPAFEKFYWSIAHHYYYNPDSLSYILNKLDKEFLILPEQRYDLSNHITWMTEGKPGGQGKYNNIFSPSTIDAYQLDLINTWNCDTLILFLKNG